MEDNIPIPVAVKKSGRPPKDRVGSAPVPDPEPMSVTYSLKGGSVESFRCSVREQEGPFLVFVSREGWKERRFYVAISEIATLEIVGHPQLVSVPVGVSSQPSGVMPGVPPSAVAPAVLVGEMPPPGSYAAATTFKEMQAKTAMLRSDPARLQSTVVGPNGGIEVVGAAFMDGAPE